MRIFDVAIIGGGVIGASIACELAGEKLHAVVLDAKQPGREASWAAGGMLSPAPHFPGDSLLTPLGNESLRIYPEFVARVEETSGIATDFSQNGAIAIFGGGDSQADCDRAIAENRRVGAKCEALTAAEAREKEPSLGPAARAAIWLPDEAAIDPRLLMDALLAATQSRGVKIRSDCAVTALHWEGDRCAGVVAGGEKIVAQHVVVAAGCFCGAIADGKSGGNGILARYAPTRPVRGQMLSLRARDVNIGRPIRSARGYIVPRRDGRIVAGSTIEEVGFDKNMTPEGMRAILESAAEIVPGLEGADVVETWTGLRPGTPDALPILGPTDVDGLLIATGHYRNGILLAPITAKIIRNWIVDEDSRMAGAEAFSPLRFNSKNTAEIPQ